MLEKESTEQPAKLLIDRYNEINDKSITDHRSSARQLDWKASVVAILILLAGIAFSRRVMTRIVTPIESMTEDVYEPRLGDQKLGIIEIAAQENNRESLFLCGCFCQMLFLGSLFYRHFYGVLTLSLKRIFLAEFYRKPSGRHPACVSSPCLSRDPAQRSAHYFSVNTS